MTQPVTMTIPNRKPYVRCPTFIDSVGPPPAEFFDETQDHLSAYIHSHTGWKWSSQSSDMEDLQITGFGTELHPPFRLNSSGCTVTRAAPTPASYPTGQGQHACLSIGGSATPWYCYGATSAFVPGQYDFLVSAKVRLDGALHFDIMEGLFVGLDFGIGADGTGGRARPIGFEARGVLDATWRLTAPAVGLDFDTGVPVVDGRWTVLQISRSSGGMRFFIDNRLIWIPDRNGILREGVYMPTVTTTRRAFRVNRQSPGALADKFYLDFFHRFCQRER